MPVACSTSVRCNESLDAALSSIQSIGVEQVDILTIDGWVHLHPSALVTDFEATARALDALLHHYGLKPLALNTGTAPQLHDRSAEANRRRSAQTAALIQLMQRYNIRIAAVQPRNHDPARPYREVLRDCVATLREQTAAGRAEGITFALELHVNSPFETVEQAHMLLNEMPELALVYDPSHFIMQGIDLHETTWLLKHARLIHLRDVERGKMQVPFGTGAVDWDWLLGAISDSGYSGDFSIEYLQSNDFDALTSARQLNEKLEAWQGS